MKFSTRTGALIMACVVSRMTYSSLTVSAGQAQQVEIPSKSTFQYQIENKPDPFLPFLREKGVIVKPTQEELIPIQNYKLVGIVIVERKKVPIVEDASGKGYYLTDGTRLGKSVVSRIEDSEVHLTATYRTATGRIVTKEMKMYLKKEGDK